jgi:hypothetical protein
MNTNRNSLLFFLLVIFNSCIFDFDPPSKDYENLLVVEALLHNGEEAFVVKLSRSIPIDTAGLIPERDALVSIADNTGNIFELTEYSPGQYFSSPDFRGQAGKMYQLHIQTAQGRRYESDSVLMRETPPIDSVYYKYEERVTAKSLDKVPGLQIYLTTHDQQNNTWYYRWEYEETWEFRSLYNSLQIWNDGLIEERVEQIHRCWKHNSSTNVLVSSSKNLDKDIISEFPVLYVSNSTDRLGVKYSILVKQYALNEKSYNYWKEQENINENLGTLFDPQPYVIKGNIYNPEDENEIVLGFFDASSVQEKRIYIKKGEYPFFETFNNYAHCTDTIVSYGQIRSLLGEGYMLVGEVSAQTSSVRYLLSYESCIDCTLYGINVEPDFW